MNTTKNKSKISTIALILMLTISATLIALPTATAQPDTKQSYPYIGAVPNPAAAGKQVLLHVGITDSLATVDLGWEDITVTVVDPEGNEQTLGPYRTDSTGGTGAVFTPNMVGTYYLSTNFPAQWYNYTGFGLFGPQVISIFYEASTSEPLELVVLSEEEVEFYPSASLPSEYWTRPVDAQLREWTTIAGNWLTTPSNLYAPYNDGPETSHILWRSKLTTGGLVGGDLCEQSFEDGDAYEGFFSGAVIINGVLYYNRYKSGYPTQEVVALDLHTGEELWIKILGDNEELAFGQTFYWSSYNYHGTFDYLWTTVRSTWTAYDAYTGVEVYSMENVPSGTRAYGPRGEIYIYTVDGINGWMTLWNSSRVVSDSGSWMGGFSGAGYGVYNATLGIEWNKTLSEAGLEGSINAILDDRVIGSSADSFLGTGTNDINLWAISTEAGNEGEVLYNEIWERPAGNLSLVWAAESSEDKVGVIWAKETQAHYGFSLETGELIWGPTDPQYYLDALDDSVSDVRCIAYGRLYSASVGGILYCYNVTTGELLWSYEATDNYSEILWANNWWLKPLVIADEKIYVAHTEHSAIDPKPRGAPFICINALTGDVIWRIDGAFRQTRWGGRAIIGDSIIATMNTYDQQIYGISKGPSATTVSAAPKVVTKGSSVVIEGSVTDVSPGTADTVIAARFPNGVPAVSDESMNEWMKYVYMQFDRPTDAVGVTVKLEAIDPNGNYQNLGTTTTDSYGNYGFTFEPEVEGQYMVIAAFEGSEAYYGSTSTTYLAVDAASASTPIEPDTETPDTETPDTQTPDTETPATEAPLISTEVAIIAAVAVACVIGAAAFWSLRKRK
ncbi:MAG: hypothetical protein CW691_11490 [Candidatus Bathyarchaeum sp.]|nr:MAG: hypothetical protein CW691_11490 [Candidatus Bathyarchaeum sp.]